MVTFHAKHNIGTMVVYKAERVNASQRRDTLHGVPIDHGVIESIIFHSDKAVYVLSAPRDSHGNIRITDEDIVGIVQIEKV